MRRIFGRVMHSQAALRSQWDKGLKNNSPFASPSIRCPTTKLPLFLKWGIVFGEAYEVPERAAREVLYADRFELEQEILRRQEDDMDDGGDGDFPPLPAARAGGQSHAPAPQPSGAAHQPVFQEKEHSRLPRRMPLRTD